MLGLGLGVSTVALRGGGIPAIITGTAPVLAPLSNGDTLSTAVTWGSYTSTAGTINEPVREMSVNGAAFVAYDGTVVVAADDTYQLRETVTDSAANTRAFFTGVQAVAGVAPTVAASDALVGRTLTITVDSSTGVPAPTFALTALTLDGVNVLGNHTGAGPWEYVVPDGVASQTVAWTVTASNSAGSATSSGSEAVAANLFAPVAAGTIADQSYTIDTAITPLNIASDFTGTAPITYALAPSSAALPAGLSLSSVGELTGTVGVPVAALSIVVRGTNAYGFADTAFSLTIAAASGIDALLFGSDEPGFWFDYSDTSTLFQDTAGTLPVTAPGQTVALSLDKSKGLVLGPELVTNGTFDTDLTGWTNSGSWSWSGGAAVTTGAFGTLTQLIGGRNNAKRITIEYVKTSGRLQLQLIDSTGVNAITSWGGAADMSALGVSPLNAFIPAGYDTVRLTTTDPFAMWAINNISVKELPGAHATQPTAANRPTYGIVPKTGRRNALLATDTMATQTRTVAAVQHTLSFQGTGSLTLTGASTAGPLVGTGASDIVSLTFTPTAGDLTLTVSGTVELAQLEKGAARTGYQRVVSQYNVTEAGVPSLGYLQADGADDWMVTPTITPGVDKAFIGAGLRKLSDAARGTVVEMSASIAANNGAIHLTAPDAASATFAVESKGTTLTAAVDTGIAAPASRVIAALGDIAGDRSTLRINGVQEAQNTGDQGTGNYLAYPAYIGRRAGTSLPFNGQLHQLIVRFGPNLDAADIEKVEQLLAQKTAGVDF